MCVSGVFSGSYAIADTLDVVVRGCEAIFGGLAVAGGANNVDNLLGWCG